MKATGGLLDLLPQNAIDRLLSAWQTIATLFFGLLLLITVTQSHKLSAPGAPVVLYWVAVAVSAVTIVAHLPPVFRFFTPRSRGVVYLLSFGTLILIGATRTGLEAAWVNTPRGAEEARRAAVAEQAEAAAAANLTEAQTSLQETEALLEELQDKVDQLERCFTTFGHRLPALERAVKDSLHNPNAFEHVETVVIVPDENKNTVAMTFRAENNFGAIKTLVVKASVYPENCEVASVDSPQLL